MFTGEQTSMTPECKLVFECAVHDRERKSAGDKGAEIPSLDSAGAMLAIAPPTADLRMTTACAERLGNVYA